MRWLFKIDTKLKDQRIFGLKYFKGYLIFSIQKFLHLASLYAFIAVCTEVIGTCHWIILFTSIKEWLKWNISLSAENAARFMAFFVFASPLWSKLGRSRKADGSLVTVNGRTLIAPLVALLYSTTIEREALPKKQIIAPWDEIAFRLETAFSFFVNLLLRSLQRICRSCCALEKVVPGR